jgi:hypothetical protein
MCTECQLAKQAGQLAKQVEARDTAQLALDLAVERIKTIEHPCARLVAVVTLLGQPPITSFDRSDPRVYYPAFGGEVLTDVCPEVWPIAQPFRSMTEEMGGWDSMAVAQWFASSATAAGISPSAMVPWRITREHRVMLKKRVSVEESPPEPAWAFFHAGSAGPLHAYVFADGRLGERESEEPAIPGKYIRCRALIQMADMLKLNFRTSVVALALTRPGPEGFAGPFT